MYRPKELIENGIRVDIRPDADKDAAHAWCKEYWKNKGGSPKLKWMWDSTQTREFPNLIRVKTHFKFNDAEMAMWFKMSWG